MIMTCARTKNIKGIPLHYCVAAAQGRREYMEDTYCVSELHDKRMLFAIFDGHGGQCVAKYCAKNLTTFINSMQSNQKQNTTSPAYVDRLFMSLDEDACYECPSHCGATALLLFADKHKLHFANCGDSMAMIIDKQGNTHMMSVEHKVENKDEKARIEAAGGVITYDDGTARINRQLNVARALGDAHLKEYVISDPYQAQFPINNVRLVIMASDGLWDVYTPSQLAADVKEYEAMQGLQSLQSLHSLQRQTNKQSLAQSQSQSNIDAGLSSWLITRAIHQRGSSDNITVITIRPEI